MIAMPIVRASAARVAMSLQSRHLLATILAVLVGVQSHAEPAAEGWEGDFRLKDLCAAEGASALAPSHYQLRVRRLSAWYFGFHFVTCQSGTQHQCEMTGVGRRNQSGDQLVIVSLVGGAKETCKAKLRLDSAEIVLQVEEGCSAFCSANSGADGTTFIGRSK